jgi:hypothetical protein
VPQDIPLEASEKLVFTPPCLEQIDPVPTLTIRTATNREKRMLRRLHMEAGLRRHGIEAIRAEVLRGLETQWSAEAFAGHKPTIEGYWRAGDDYALQKADDPDLVFDFDEEVAAAVDQLTRDVADAWPPLRRMLADNSECDDLAPVLTAAVMIERWTGIDTPRVIERGYLTMDCAEALRDELEAMERRAGMPTGRAFAQVLGACLSRFSLAEDEEKNSASPSPSPTPPPSSNTKSARGVSKASASSTETPATTSGTSTGSSSGSTTSATAG